MSANAAPFVPRAKAPAQSVASHDRRAQCNAADASADCSLAETSDAQAKKRSDWEQTLCPYYEADGCCPEADCALVHGAKCDMCDRFVLHPTSDELRKAHNVACMAEHVRAMELAFATQRSATQQCSICMDNVLEQTQRFGILNNCKHCFCLRCSK